MKSDTLVLDDEIEGIGDGWLVGGSEGWRGGGECSFGGDDRCCPFRGPMAIGFGVMVDFGKVKLYIVPVKPTLEGDGVFSGASDGQS